jgi:flavin-binding protein dodecin
VYSITEIVGASPTGPMTPSATDPGDRDVDHFQVRLPVGFRLEEPEERAALST